MTEPTVRPGANAESAPLNLRAPHEVIERLTRVASKLPPGLFSKHKLAVIALEHGLAVIERDPMILLRGPASAAPPSSPESPVAPVAPAAPAPEARAERVERTPRVVPAVALVPVVDTRQGHLPITATVANDAPMSESSHAPSEPSAAPKRTRDDDDALRVRYRAALAAKRLVGTHTATSIGCSEASLRGWAIGSTKNLKREWLAALASVLDALDAKGVPA